MQEENSQKARMEILIKIGRKLFVKRQEGNFLYKNRKETFCKKIGRKLSNHEDGNTDKIMKETFCKKIERKLSKKRGRKH